MRKLEKYLLENESFLQACNDYISDGKIVVSKSFIFSKVLRYFKTTDIDICKNANVPYEKGELYELPDYVLLKKNRTMTFKLDEEYSFDYKYIDFFLDGILNKLNITFYHTKIEKLNIPILKVFYYDHFVGFICAYRDKMRNK